MREEQTQALTITELRLKVIENGMSPEHAELFTTKDQLFGVLERQKTMKAPTLNDNENYEEKKTVNKIYNTKKDIMREILKKQPRSRTKLPLTGSETVGVVTSVGALSDDQLKKMNISKTPVNSMDTVHLSGSIRPVTINGYTIHVPKGVYVNLPEQVAELLGEAEEETAKAGQDILLDRVDPESGRKVSELM